MTLFNYAPSVPLPGPLRSFLSIINVEFDDLSAQGPRLSKHTTNDTFLDEFSRSMRNYVYWVRRFISPKTILPFDEHASSFT